MKRLSILFVIVVFLFGCEEIFLVIILVMQVESICDEFVLIIDQQCQVLVEEFIGVCCVNCLAGSVVFEEFIGQYGD